MLPILTAMANIGPFLAVVLCPLGGFAHAYYGMGLHRSSIVQTFMIVYRLGFVGDFDGAEMENVDEYTQHKGDSWSLKTDKTVWWGFVQFFILVTTLVLTIAMMNIFIGVLGQSYSEALQASEALFWRARAQIVLDENAKREGYAKLGSIIGAMGKKICPRPLRNVFCCLCHARVYGTVASFRSHTMDDGEGDDAWNTHYVWFCRPKETQAETKSEHVMPDMKDYIWYCEPREDLDVAVDTMHGKDEAPFRMQDYVWRCKPCEKGAGADNKARTFQSAQAITAMQAMETPMQQDRLVREPLSNVKPSEDEVKEQMKQHMNHFFALATLLGTAPKVMTNNVLESFTNKLGNRDSSGESPKDDHG